MATGKLSDPTPAQLETLGSDAAAYEAETVHAVYDAIAPHFSATRYKPWPLIPQFLASLPPGSIGADLGCGNGKYLPIYSPLAARDAWVSIPAPKKKTPPPPPKRSSKIKRNQPPPEPEPPKPKPEFKPPGTVLTIGADMSAPLVEHAARNSGHLLEHGQETTYRNEVAVGDALLPSMRAQAFDYALSIATIHHFSTWERRRAAVQELIRLVRPVKSSHSAPAASTSNEPSPAQTEEQARLEDQASMGLGPGRFMVYAWSMEQRGGRRAAAFEGKASEAESSTQATEQERPNQDLLVPWVLAKEHQQKAKEEQEFTPETKVYQRYYHVFTEGELERLVEEAGATFASSPYASGCSCPVIRLRRERSGWDRGNWWGVWSVLLEDDSV